MDQLLFFLPLVVAVGVIAVAVTSFFTFGGVWRNAGAQFALGSYSMLLGILFSLAFFSEDARGNDVFLNNAVAAELFLLVGSTLLICGLAGFGLNRWLVAVLAVANPILGGVITNFVTLNTPQVFIPLVALDAAALMALGVILARRQQRWQIPALGVLLAVGGLVVVSVVYYFLGTYYLDQFGKPKGPPYLEGNVTILSLALGLIIFLIDRAWSKGRTPQRTA